jgi:hypothetical protein
MSRRFVIIKLNMKLNLNPKTPKPQNPKTPDLLLQIENCLTCILC